MYYIASDHAGLVVKNFILEYFKLKGLEIKDLYKLEKDSKVDYPDMAFLVAKEVQKDKANKGILICGSGIGVSIGANRFKDIRAALCTDSYMAKMARMHNDANVLCLGERVSGLGVIESILEAFLNTDFEGGRHTLRVNKLYN
ncbi:ribose 5-phosphate isomerase B [Helicobacter sp. 13S00401-1]|uniref:ribose 5-phosphate isomerase B n=1 Tax=Helicobacter sp. 13S00401-1 TaxID=1905758 RepID=UPI000BA69D8A|nr:ribose 5-phosphate isomerase B [Helicobacter sp. 13S00401-1]PAF49035.1 ribose 5-phosphate isomerase B [Helicobacter sp. 13S00401-1]